MATTTRAVEHNGDQGLDGLESLIEHLPIGIYRTTPDGRVLLANPAIARLLGYASVDELSRVDLARDLYTEDFPRARFLERIERDGELRGLEFSLRRRDGSVIGVREHVRAVRDAKGQTLYYEGALEDVTEQQRTAEALVASENRIREIVEHSTNLFYSHTPDHVLTYVSPQTRTFLDCEPEDALVRWTEFVTEDAGNRLGFESTERAIRSGERQPPYHLELVGRKGRRIWVEVNEAPVIRDGRTVAIVGSLTDITASRRAQEELNQTLSLLSATLESTADGILVVDASGRIRSHNQRFAQMWRIPADVLASGDDARAIAFVLDQLVDPKGFLAKVQELYAQPQADSYDVLEFNDGRVFERYSIPQLVAGAVSGRVWSFRDVTKRRRAEEALKRRTDQTIAHQSVLLDVTKLQGADLPSFRRHLTAVDARTMGVERVSVWTYTDDRSEIVCDNLFLLTGPGHESGLRLRARDFPRYFEALEESRTIAADDARSDPRTSEFRASYLEPLGIASMMDVPIRLHGRVVGVLCHEHTGPPRSWTIEEQDFAASLADQFSLALEAHERDKAIQQIRKLNEELEQRVRERTHELEVANQELEAFSSSVSHDLRAPLRNINGFSQALLEDQAGRLDDEGRFLLGRMQAGTRHMAQLIDDLLELSRVTRTELRRERVDLSALVAGVADQLRSLHPDRRVEFVAAPGASVHADPHLLRVVVENLLSNAWKFTSKTPDARVEFGRVADEALPTFFVRDNGAGFDMTHVHKLFKPFERLHKMSDFEGTGIGLATVHRILQRHGGRAWADAAPGRGATIYFTV